MGAVRPYQDIVRTNDNLLVAEGEAQIGWRQGRMPHSNRKEVTDHRQRESPVLVGVTVFGETLGGHSMDDPSFQIWFPCDRLIAHNGSLDDRTDHFVHPHKRRRRSAPPDLKNVRIEEAPRARLVERDLRPAKPHAPVNDEIDLRSVRRWGESARRADWSPQQA